VRLHIRLRSVMAESKGRQMQETGRKEARVTALPDRIILSVSTNASTQYGNKVIRARQDQEVSVSSRNLFRAADDVK